MEPQSKIKRGRHFAAASERHILDLSALGIPEVPLVGRYEYHSAHPGLRTHTHPGTLEICYLARGKQTYRVGGRQYLLTGGDLFVTLPDEPHDTAGQPEDPGILYWINLRMPKRGASLLTLPARDSAILAHELLNLPERHFPGSLALKLILEEVFDICNRPDNPLKRIAVVNLMVRYLLEVVNCARRHPYMRLSHALAQIVETIHSHPEESYQLDDLAGQAGLSLSRFKARFKAEVGTAPREYILRIKIDAAKRLLRDQLPVTAVAMQLGFSSSQYFATVFKRLSEQTPRDFQRSGPIVPLRPA